MRKIRRSLLSALAILAIGISCAAQEPANWQEWNWLIGTWKGEGSGQPGTGSGTFSFSTDLSGNILVRKSHSEYPASGVKQSTVHEDLMIVYHDLNLNITRAIYFDNEGHTIRYRAAVSADSIVLTGEKEGDNPVFRLTYKLLDDKRVNTIFEISVDGMNFTTYIQGISVKQ